MIIAQCISRHSIKRLVFAKKVQRADGDYVPNFYTESGQKGSGNNSTDSTDFKAHKVVQWWRDTQAYVLVSRT